MWPPVAEVHCHGGRLCKRFVHTATPYSTFICTFMPNRVFVQSNIVRLPLCPMRAWGGGAKCDMFSPIRFLATGQRCPRGIQSALHHGVGCLAVLAAEEHF